MKTGGHAREAKRAKILQALKAGNTRKAAYEYAGVPSATFFTWLDDETFLESVREAEATAEITCATTILNSARKGDWRAADKWLTKRRRDEWGDEINLRDLTLEQLFALAATSESRAEPAGSGLAASGRAESSEISD